MMNARIRLLPVTVIAATLVLGLKVTYLVDDAGRIAPVVVSLPRAEAKSEPAEETPQASPTGGVSTEPAGDSAAPERPADSLAGRDPTTFTPAEIGLLENLARRRDEIEMRARDQEVRESLLQATAQRIDAKIQELKALEARIRSLVKQHDAAEVERMERLVKVYESMKPKDAARIFEEIEMDVLLEVAARMKEVKIAAVMAELSPKRAQDLTIELAQQTNLEAQIKR